LEPLGDASKYDFAALRLDGTQFGNFFFQVNSDRRTFCVRQMHCMPRTPVGAQRLDTNSSETLPEWMGFYALRRGIAAAVATLANAMAAKSVMRHSNLATTTAHYINSEPAEAVRAVDKTGELFDNTNGSGRPN
jgi:hypothetical protein